MLALLVKQRNVLTNQPQFYEEKKGGPSVPDMFGALFRTAHPPQEQ